MEVLETVPKRNITKALAYSNGLILHTSPCTNAGYFSHKLSVIVTLK